MSFFQQNNPATLQISQYFWKIPWQWVYPHTYLRDLHLVHLPGIQMFLSKILKIKI